MSPYLEKELLQIGLLRWEDYPGISEWALSAVTSIITVRHWEIWHRQKSRRQYHHGGRGGSDVATSQGMLAAPRSWKGARNKFSPRASWSSTACWNFDFSPINWFWTSGLRNCERIHFCCCKPPSFVATCYSSNRKLINTLLSECTWLCSSKTLLTKTGGWPAAKHRLQFDNPWIRHERDPVHKMGWREK